MRWGASLGLNLKDRRKAVILALLGAIGLTVGVFLTLILAATLTYASEPMEAIVGAVVSASLGAAFWEWRTIVALAVVGDVGFGLGAITDYFLTLRGGGANYLVRTGSIGVGGGIAGASLGAVLQYLENRNLASGRRPRVR